MKKQISTSRAQYILVSVLIALVGFGTWISCSKDATISGIDPTLRASKPVLLPSNSVDFHPQSGVNYDPFDGMTWDDRKAALGGIDGAVKHLRVVSARVAQAMQDESVRKLLHRIVPKEKEGEIHLSQWCFYQGPLSW